MPDGKQFVLYKNNEDIAETVGGVENESGLSPTDNIFNNSISQTTVNGQGNPLENDIDSVIENDSEAKTQAAAYESLADLNNSLDDIAPVSDTTANEHAVDEKPVRTVKDRNVAKLRAYETEFVNNNNLRKESLKEYNQKIAELQTEYAGKKDKYTSRHFWCRGYYVDTVGRNKRVIAEYIKVSLKKTLQMTKYPSKNT